MRATDWNGMRALWMERLGDDPRTSDEALAELLRAELSARLTVRRSTLLGSVSALLALNANTHLERCREILERLEQIGDAVQGREGLVAAAPLRLVRRRAGCYLVVGSISTQTLQRSVGPCGISPGIPRRIERWSEPDALERKIASVGAVLGAEAWAGLDRIPYGRAWLDELEEIARDATEGVVPVDWSDRQVYRPTASEPSESKRWTRDPEGQQTGLIRTWGTDGRPVYGWLTSATGSTIRRLSRDQALRTRYALDLEHEASTALPATIDATHVAFVSRIWLPSAEYRFLVCVADRFERTPEGIAVRCALESWPSVAEVLQKRMGIRLVFNEGNREEYERAGAAGRGRQ